LDRLTEEESTPPLDLTCSRCQVGGVGSRRRSHSELIRIIISNKRRMCLVNSF